MSGTADPTIPREARWRRLYRGAFYLGGCIAVGAGLDTVLRGTRSLPGSPHASAGAESDLRFYAAFYSAFGLRVLRVAGRADSDPAAVHSAAGPLFAAGLARAIAWRRAGRPHPGQIALLAVELAAPPIALAARRALERAE